MDHAPFCPHGLSCRAADRGERGFGVQIDTRADQSTETTESKKDDEEEEEEEPDCE